MATNTYVALDKVTTTGSVAFVEFTGISSSYTDLRIVIDVVGVGTGYVTAQFNSDTGSNYSLTRVGGNGSTASSNRASNQTSCDLSWSAAYTSSGRLLETVDVMNYSNSTTYKTLLSRAGKADNAVDAIVGLWRNIAAITSIKLIAGSANFASGSTFSLYGIKSEAVPTAKATGGTITYAADGYTYHTFTSSGTFTPSSSLSAQILMVAGGGSGGNAYGGGGGAGGVFYEARTLSSACTVTIGGGGAGVSSSVVGNDGSSTSFTGSTTAVGGGGGGNEPGVRSGRAGGSGGGASYTGTGGTATSGQGFAGGLGLVSGGSGVKTGAGGGAGAVATDATATAAGIGGIGTSTYSQWGIATSTGQNSSGTVYYAGGGGGIYSNISAGAGGLGGGANGNIAGAGGTSATANTGGGSGGSYGGGGASSGNGGSGIVIVRYVSA
jgi:hypothetical protein